MTTELSPVDPLQPVFTSQQRAHLQNLTPDVAARRAALDRLAAMLDTHWHDMTAAVQRDFGVRNPFETELTELVQAKGAIREAKRALPRWCRPKKRKLSLLEFPTASAWTFPQPVGVVGIIVPWNFPIAMAVQPMIGALAAGNRVMVKMSENSLHLAELLQRVSPQFFDPNEVSFFADDGTGTLGPAFSALPFNHLFFTGSADTGRKVMASAAANLTPVTLELGGKSPAIVAKDYSAERAAERILWSKMLNSGQICTSVDHVYVPTDKVDAFVRAAKAWVRKHIPDVNNGDFTSIIDTRSFARLQDTIADAKQHGAEIVELYEGPAPTGETRVLPPKLVLKPTTAMRIMQREIFGPVLPVIAYDDINAVVAEINSRPRPLAFYVFSDDRKLQHQLVQSTISGGVGINEPVVQAGIHDLPFGGSGDSGMGHYHGHEGFLTFSKLRPVFRQGPIRALDFVLPPYSGRAAQVLSIMKKLGG